MKLRFVKINPCGNTTVFVLDPVPRDQYGAIGDAIMSFKNVGAEQVGYIFKDPEQKSGWRMSMAGGEFCGNGSRSFAAWLQYNANNGSLAALKDTEVEQEIAVSGAAQPLNAHVRGMDAENSCYVTVQMPLPKRILTGRDPWFGEYSLVIFEGISHLVLWDHEQKPDDVEKARELLTVSGPMPDAFGLMYYDEKEHFMRPLVYVEETKTLVWENSCGSGSSALASAMAARADSSLKDILVKQPGGELHIDVDWQDGSVRNLVLGGVIEITATGEIYV